MWPSIHKIVIIRLMVGWVFLCMALSGLLYVREQTDFNQRLFALTSDAVRHFSNNKTQLALTADLAQHLPALQQSFTDSRFVGIRLFNEDHHLLWDAWKPLHSTVSDAVSKPFHEFPAESTAHFDKIWAGGQMHVRVVMPVISRGNTVIGYFEGIYVVDRTVVGGYFQRLWEILAIAVIAVTLSVVTLYPVIMVLNRRITHAAQELLESNTALLRSLGSAVSKKDTDTDLHNYRVTLYAVRLAEALGVHQPDMQRLIVGAFLHDVGKIGVPDHILLKPGRLTEEEYTQMKSHVFIGADIIASAPWLLQARDIVLFHHERWDGSGYPSGLAGNSIPYMARLFAVADVFDALTSKRPYKQPYPLEEALHFLQEGMTRLFDEQIVTVFLHIAPALHDSFTRASTATLKQMLDEAVTRYCRLPFRKTTESLHLRYLEWAVYRARLNTISMWVHSSGHNDFVATRSQAPNRWKKMKHTDADNLQPEPDQPVVIVPNTVTIHTDASKIVSAYKHVKTQVLLAKYNLHYIDQHELEVFLTLLHQRQVITEESAVRLLIHGCCVFDSAPDDTKLDFIEALEIRAEMLVSQNGFGSQDCIERLVSDNISSAINDAKRIDIARHSDASDLATD